MSTAAPSETVRSPHAHWPKTALRVAFGAVWLIDAILKWLPGFRSAFTDAISESADGQPGWLGPWFRFWIRLETPRATFFEYFVAVLETLIAVAVIAGFARKLTYTAAIVFSLLIWSTVEGFGGPYTSGSSDIGTAVVYALVFSGLLGFSYYEGTSQYSVDFYLERRYGWWHRVAEVGREHRLIPTRGARSAAGPASTTAPHAS